MNFIIALLLSATSPPAPLAPQQPQPLGDVATAIPQLRRTITLHLTGVSVESALREIGRRSELPITYNDRILPKAKTIWLSQNDIRTDQALEEVLRGSGLRLMALNTGQVIVVKGEELPAVAGAITGTVTEAATGQPVQSAQVSVSGTSLAQRTGADGRYTITGVTAGNRNLVVRRLGFEPMSRVVDVPDAGRVTADFALVSATTELAAVVTTVTGGQRRVELGNAISRIRADSTVANTPVRNIGELIAGRAAGVQVMFPSGTSGSAPRIRIRGTNSITGVNDPLVIVDGVRVDNSSASLTSTGRLADINPEEIETLDVVKGPSAATLYGTDAANGVIVITTKKGRAGAAQWTVYAEQGQLKAPKSNWWTNYYGWGRTTAGNQQVQCLLPGIAAGTCVQDSLTTFNPMLESPSSPLVGGGRRQHGAQVSGGVAQLKYFVGGDLENETGYLGLSDHELAFQRQRLGGSAVPNDQVTPNEVTKISARGNMGAMLGRTADLNVSAGIVRNNTRLSNRDVFSGARGGRGTTDTLTQWANSLRPANAFATVVTEDVVHSTTGVTANWGMFDWLVARANVGVDLSNIDQSRLLRRGESAITPTGSRGRTLNSILLTSADAGATAVSTPRHDIASRTSLGGQFNRRRSFATTISGTQLPPASETVTGAAAITGSESEVTTVVAGGYVEESMAYRERLFLTAALRFDGSSSFGEDFKVATYPKLGASWLVLNGEPADGPLGAGTLRLRAAFGASGVQPDPTAARSRYSLSSGLLNGAAVNAAAIGAIGNANVRPERQTEIEGGVDVELSGGRLRAEATAYNRTSRDALITRSFGLSLGVPGSQLVNVGAVRNRGVEGLIEARMFERPIASLEIVLNGSINQNRLLSLGPDIQNLAHGFGAGLQHTPGYPLYGLWDRSVVRFADANANGILEPTEIVLGDTAVFQGGTIPSRQLGLTTSVGLLNGRLRMSTLIDYRGGHLRYNNTYANRCLGTGATGTSCREVNDRTTPLDQQLKAVLRNLSPTVNSGFYENGTYTRLRELSISYVEPRLARYLRARDVSLLIAARNLATWTPYSGIDPESAIQSTDDLIADQFFPPLGRYFIARINLRY